MPTSQRPIIACGGMSAQAASQRSTVVSGTSAVAGYTYGGSHVTSACALGSSAHAVFASTAANTPSSFMARYPAIGGNVSQVSGIASTSRA